MTKFSAAAAPKWEIRVDKRIRSKEADWVWRVRYSNSCVYTRVTSLVVGLRVWLVAGLYVRVLLYMGSPWQCESTPAERELWRIAIRGYRATGGRLRWWQRRGIVDTRLTYSPSRIVCTLVHEVTWPRERARARERERVGRSCKKKRKTRRTTSRYDKISRSRQLFRCLPRSSFPHSQVFIVLISIQIILFWQK